jgi:hypothetical protein
VRWRSGKVEQARARGETPDLSEPGKAADWLNENGHLGKIGRDEARQLLLIAQAGGERVFIFNREEHDG